MIGALVGAGLSAAGSIFGAIQNRNAMRDYRAQVDAQRAANEAWYERRYNEDPLARASAVRMMTEVGDRIKRANRAAAGTRAVMGGTEESIAATQQANAEALASTASQIAASADSRRDNIEAQYRTRDAELANQQAAIKLGQAQNIAAATQGVANAAGSIATSIDAPTQYDISAADTSATGSGYTPPNASVDTTALDWKAKNNPYIKSPFTS